MPDLDLAAIRARVDAAAPGLWTAFHFDGASEINGRNPDESGGGFETIAQLLRIPCTCCVPKHGERPTGRDDAEFIAHARTDIPTLVSALERVLALADEWERMGQVGRAAAIRRAVREE